MDPHRIKVVLRHPLALLGGVLVATYALGAIVLNIVVDTDAVRDWLAPRASTVLNRPVTVGDARVALLPRPSIHVSDVRVDNLAGFDGPALGSVERMRLDVAWLPLLIGRVRVRTIQLEGPRVYLAVDEHGTSNFGDLAPDWGGAERTGPAPVSFDFDRVSVSNADLSYFDAPNARSFNISGADLEVTVQPNRVAGWRADVTAASDSLQLRLASLTEEIRHIAGPTASLTLRSDGTGRAIDVPRGSLELAGQTLAVRGRIVGLEGEHPNYDLQLSNEALDADVLALAFPSSVRSEQLPHLDGTLGVTFQVTGSRNPGGGPLMRGSIRLDDVALHLGGNLMVDHVHGVAGVAPDTVVLDSVAGTFADGPFELSGVVDRESMSIALMASVDPDLDALDRLGLVPHGTTLSGDAAVDVSIAGSLDALDSVDVAGTVALAGVQAKHSRVGVPLYVPAGELVVAGRDVSWTELPVLVGEDRLVTSGTAEGVLALPRDDASVPRVDVMVQGPHLDLGAILTATPNADDVGYPQVAFAHLGGRSVDGRGAPAVVAAWGMSRPTQLPVGGTLRLELDSLDFRDRHLESVTATVELGDSVLTVEAPSFTAWGGAAGGTLRLGVGLSREEPFSLSLHVEDATAEDLLTALTPIDDAVFGRLSMELQVEGLTDASLLPVGRDLSGSVTLRAADGRVSGTGPNLAIADFLGSEEWNDVAFTTWDTDIVIDDRRLEVRSSDLEGPQARVAMAGLVLLDGSHDLSIGLSIPPERLADVSLRRTGIAQSVLDRLSAAGSSLEIGLRMSGLIWAPSLEPDASSAMVSAR